MDSIWRPSASSRSHWSHLENIKMLHEIDAPVPFSCVRIDWGQSVIIIRYHQRISKPMNYSRTLERIELERRWKSSNIHIEPISKFPQQQPRQGIVPLEIMSSFLFSIYIYIYHISAENPKTKIRMYLTLSIFIVGNISISDSICVRVSTFVLFYYFIIGKKPTLESLNNLLN